MGEFHLFWKIDAGGSNFQLFGTKF